MIDWSHLAQLYQEVGSESFEEVVDLFFEEVSDVIARLESSTDTSDLAEDMHFLKGSALSLGFYKMSQLCHDGEKAAVQGDADKVDLSAIFQSYAASRKEFVANYRLKLTA
ncbi:MAG: Hpt domain-containing protein [Sulfitobacter sp.]